MSDFKASGILIRTKIGDEQFYFMTLEKKRGLWGDIGGKRDKKDKSILSLAPINNYLNPKEPGNFKLILSFVE